ncbi:hypothetical protein FISHEDRAFT_35383 [Fistulina hepatica ATCC 64428]|uniref:Uncharacterized protein n=1 Tax=Fistulina hepatica ATCC 64428 TaxID=1128425 RepID=A0A0D7AKM8_9AGAR|nr:hypothetical protein FISHEDRAFT_35383 [Fistulina hepatica ATCC 64428]
MPPKRKSDAGGTASQKKARLELEVEGARVVADILSGSPDSCYALTDDVGCATTLHDALVEVAQYARSLQQQVAALKPKEKSKEDIAVAADKLAAAVQSGITKQMTWKPSCKQGTARWVYDGVCADPMVFVAILGMSEPMKNKTKKLTVDEFEDLFGSCTGHARYNTLYLKGDIKVHWKPDEGTFKLTGSYGA